MKKSIRLILALGAIFVSVAVSACGSSVPGDSVATVAGNPITARALAHWGYVAAVGQSQASPGSPVIVPDPPTFTKCMASLRKIAPASVPASTLKTACLQQFQQTLEYLVRSDWVQGQAAKEGLKVSNAAVMTKFNTAKNAQFKTAASFQQFLTASGQTLNDILYRFRISLLATKLATPAAVQAYYKAHMSTYSTPERVNARIILTKTPAQAQAALTALRSHQSWKATAKKYSTDTATKNIGGLLTGVTAGQEPAALSTALFSAPHLKLLGPIKTPFGYYVAEVTDIFPASTEPIAKATATIKQTLAAAALSAPPWEKQWKAKTTCRAGFGIPDCKNYIAPKTTSTTTPAPTTGTSTATAPAPATTPTPPTATTGSSTTQNK